MRTPYLTDDAVEQQDERIRAVPEDPSPLSDLALLAEWTMTLLATDLSPLTIRHYTYAVFRLLEHHRFAVHLWDMEPSHIVAFLGSLGNRSAAKHQYAKGLESFYGWAVAASYLLTNPVVVKVRKKARRAPDSFTHDDLTRLLIAAAWRDPRRAWAILACYSLGCRRGEFVSIRVMDIEWERERLYLRKTKFDKPRYIPIGPLARIAIIELLHLSSGELLLEIQPNTMTNWVHQAGIDCGFSERKLRAHTLRASFITDLANAGTPVHVIASIVGHENIATTSAYLAVAEPQRHKAVQVLD